MSRLNNVNLNEYLKGRILVDFWLPAPPFVTIIQICFDCSIILNDNNVLSSQAVFGHTFSGICNRNSQLNCMQRLCDWVNERSISVSYIYIYIYI